MSLLATRRSRLAASASTAVLVVGATLVASAPAATAAVLNNVTISAVNPAKVVSGLANRVILINGTNFDEDQITGISLGADPDCQNLQSYVVTSTTQISVKTPGVAPSGVTPDTAAPGCRPTPGNVAEDVTINQIDATGATGSVTRATAITFVPPPSIGTLVTTAGSEAFPIFTENSSALDMADRARQLTSAGGQLVRIKAGADFAFDGRSSAGLTGSLAGKALTTVGFLDSTGATQAINSAPTGNGNFWIARTATALTPTDTPTLAVTQGTVTRTFAADVNGLSVVAAPTVTSLDVTSGKTGAITAVKITGTNFGTSATELQVTMCGRIAPIVGTPTNTSITVNTPNSADSTSPTTNAQLKTALGGTAGVCPVVVTRTPAGGTAMSSAITAASFFAFVDR